MPRTPSRIYAVIDGDALALVRATHPAQAMAHISRGRFKVRVASQDDLVAAMGAGVPIADATRDDPNSQTLGGE